MDTDMTDAAYDIDIDVGAGIETTAPPLQQIHAQGMMADKNEIPAAYTEDAFTVRRPWPESVNLQGVGDFDPNDPLYYAMEHCGAEPRVKQLRWVNDSSVNLEFYSAQDAEAALGKLTDAAAGDPNMLELQTSRKAKPYSKKPNSMLTVRESNDGDQKPRGAANRSNYYRQNPDVAGNRQREPRRRPPPKRDYLDYGDEDTASGERTRRRSGSEDETMNDDPGYDRRRPRWNGRESRDNRDNREVRGRGGRSGRDGDSGRLRGDIDSYRPRSNSANESRFGRLRGRSASPASDEDGDGRYGFAEDSAHAGRRRYRSRSRSRNTRRQREPSGERWTHDRANYDRPSTAGGRWQKDTSAIESSPMGNHHRRSFAIDASVAGSLLARMTKDGQPVVPQQKRSLAERMTRDNNDDDDDEMTYGRLKNNDRDPWVTDFSEPAPKRGLADRITRDNDINIRGRGQEGINIRGSASSNVTTEGINIRGVASGV